MKKSAKRTIFTSTTIGSTHVGGFQNGSAQPALVWNSQHDDYAVAWNGASGAPGVSFGVVGGPAPTAVGQNPALGLPPAIAAGPDGYGIVWQSNSSELVFALMSPDGGSPTTLANSAAPTQTPSIIWTGTQWVIAWTDIDYQIQISTCPK